MIACLSSSGVAVPPEIASGPALSMRATIAPVPVNYL